MRQSVARIGRVKPKRGGDFTIINKPNHTDAQEDILKNTRQIVEGLGHQLHSYVVVAWSDSGLYQMGTRISRKGPIGPTSAPSFVADIVRRELLGPIIVDENIIYD